MDTATDKTYVPFAVQTDEEKRVYEWNRDFLLGLGVSNIGARACASEVDPHAVKALVDRGCDPEVALDILR